MSMIPTTTQGASVVALLWRPHPHPNDKIHSSCPSILSHPPQTTLSHSYFYLHPLELSASLDSPLIEYIVDKFTRGMTVTLLPEDQPVCYIVLGIWIFAAAKSTLPIAYTQSMPYCIPVWCDVTHVMFCVTERPTALLIVSRHKRSILDTYRQLFDIFDIMRDRPRGFAEDYSFESGILALEAFQDQTSAGHRDWVSEFNSLVLHMRLAFNPSPHPTTPHLFLASQLISKIQHSYVGSCHEWVRKKMPMMRNVDIMRHGIGEVTDCNIVTRREPVPNPVNPTSSLPSGSNLYPIRHKPLYTQGILVDTRVCRSGFLCLAHVGTSRTSGSLLLAVLEDSEENQQIKRIASLQLNELLPHMRSAVRASQWPGRQSRLLADEG
ncbi:uncharacterized protein H6S33_006292 [Morchella sextelata]|uniref:uncharacterized protein n=1 Tax=Morchella sextelata TaxID=1174677 RepID=UPI001D05AAAE|nr:uncharacterized protein H6S33_006292 [Morchella sextelata]KAH0604624.1 hypothetical protein H6S33_006292 [Morchella sextelata]